MTQYQSRRPTLQIVDTTEEKTINQVQPNTPTSKPSNFSKLFWNDLTNILADLFFQAMQINEENGKSLLPVYSSAIIDFIKQSSNTTQSILVEEIYTDQDEDQYFFNVDCDGTPQTC